MPFDLHYLFAATTVFPDIWSLKTGLTAYFYAEVILRWKNQIVSLLL